MCGYVLDTSKYYIQVHIIHEFVLYTGACNTHVRIRYMYVLYKSAYYTRVCIVHRCV